MLPFLLLGRVAIWATQTTPLLDFVRRRELGQELLSCDFCTGFWVYSLLHLVFGLSPWGLPKNRNVVVNAAANGIVTSFVMHIFRFGWEKRFHE